MLQYLYTSRDKLRYIAPPPPAPAAPAFLNIIKIQNNVQKC